MVGSTNSVFWGGTSAVKDGVTGATVTTTAPSTNLIPAPGALALIGLAGFSSRRRRA
jgi:MYXO-CTERM domain-containing protein